MNSLETNTLKKKIWAKDLAAVIMKHTAIHLLLQENKVRILYMAGHFHFPSHQKTQSSLLAESLELSDSSELI